MTTDPRTDPQLLDAARAWGAADPDPATRAELERLTRRRDAITAQLAQLRDVVAGFGADDGDDGDEARATDGGASSGSKGAAKDKS